MNTLGDLKKFFELNSVKIKEFGGWYLTTESGDKWTLFLGEFYKNGESVIEKELVNSFKKDKKN